MAKVYTRFNKRPTEPAPAGSKEEPNYIVTLNGNGEKVIEQHGFTNIYDIIQESADDVDIEKIVRRATLGDATALNKIVGTYMDVTDMPTNLAQAQQLVINLTNEFNKLPINIRREFNMAPEQYVATYGTGKWFEIMGLGKEEKNIEQRSREPLHETTAD